MTGGGFPLPGQIHQACLLLRRGAGQRLLLPPAAPPSAGSASSARLRCRGRHGSIPGYLRFHSSWYCRCGGRHDFKRSSLGRVALAKCWVGGTC